MLSNTIGYIHRILIVQVKALHKKSEELEKSYNNLKEEIEERRKDEEKVEHLSGLLPICASCKKIRDDKGYWMQIESYIETHSEA